VVVIAVMAAINLRGWLLQDKIPRQDFAGYAAAAQYVAESVLDHGLVPVWDGKWFAGTTNFLSSLKEHVALPLVLLAGPVRGLKLMILLAKIAAALALYVIFVRHLGAPLAGLVAAQAYAFAPRANHATQRLDVALSYVLLPLVLLVAVDLARRRRPAAAALLGLLIACQVDVNYTQASVGLGMLLVLATLRPWRAEAGTQRDVASAKGAGFLFTTAMGAFVLFGGSQVAWLATDMSNHAFFSPSQLTFAWARYSEYSPFLLLNRANWMGGWLAAHLPPGADTGDEWLDARYPGLTVVLVCIAGWFTVRHRPTLRRWYQVGITLMLLQYWMSMGPRTFLWEVVASFRGSDALTRALERIASAMAFVAAARGLVLLLRADLRHDARARHRGEFWLGVGIVSALLSYPLFNLAATIPGVGRIRSPGRFFDLVPFSVSLVFGVSLIGIRAKIRDAWRWPVVAIAIGLLVVVDFWPTTRRFYDGTPPAVLADLDAALRGLPGENGTLRVLPVSPWGWLVAGPPVSLSMMNSEAGGVRSWLPWQAGRYWPDFVSTDLRRQRGPECLPWGPEVSCDFLAVARVKYVLQMPPWVLLRPPWTRRAATSLFTLWERPDVMPMSYGARAYVVFVGGEDDIGDVVDEALAHHLIVVSAGPSLRAVPADIVRGAAAIRYGAGAVREDEPALPETVARRLVGPVGQERALAALVGAAERPLLDVAYTRPGPEEIVLETDAGDAPTMIHVAESYHPWWTAHVDGRLHAVVRGQRSFMAVLVGPGKHRIELRLERPLVVRFADGAAAVAWGLLALGGLAWIVSAPRRAAPKDGHLKLPAEPGTHGS
jgi:hypothetical protein